MDTLLMAAILDQERVSNWRHTKDAKKKQNFPKSILDAMLGKEEKEKKDDIAVFDSPEEFKARREKLLSGG